MNKDKKVEKKNKEPRCSLFTRTACLDLYHPFNPPCDKCPHK